MYNLLTVNESAVVRHADKKRHHDQRRSSGNSLPSPGSPDAFGVDGELHHAGGCPATDPWGLKAWARCVNRPRSLGPRQKDEV